MGRTANACTWRMAPHQRECAFSMPSKGPQPDSSLLLPPRAGRLCAVHPTASDVGRDAGDAAYLHLPLRCALAACAGPLRFQGFLRASLLASRLLRLIALLLLLLPHRAPASSHAPIFLSPLALRSTHSLLPPYQLTPLLPRSSFRAEHVKEKWAKDLYIAGIAYGRTVT